VGPGRYRNTLALASGAGAAYRFEPLPGGGLDRSDITRLGVRTLTYPWSDEYKMLPPNNALLRALSEQTGGVFAPKADAIFAAHADSGLTAHALWPWFAAAGLILFVLDILVRRVPRF
jgi:hypothetical protein